MRIAVLGTGQVGRNLASGLANIGHEITVGTRDVKTTLAATEPGAFAGWAEQHPQVKLATFADAAANSELVVNAAKGTATLDVLTAAGAENLSDKILIEVSNPLDFGGGFPATLTVKDTDSLGEQVQRAFPQALVVKTLNTIANELMIEPKRLAGGDHTVFVSGNDADAKATVTDILTALGHEDVIDLGDITTARGTEMYLGLWMRLFQSLGTLDFNIKVTR
ncbi:NADPH-dependent F420 reductase [Natronoglycomyces albus]|uniref:NAD(P)-binding domain-containing protein n=1 Tax=Natronoglycomyces albus TaxID=2811108 RepID=A0A895XMK5_9ACTN|nr:NAD(P)-binding domain-containing protein [Natronoglycomyces albus]QSB06357.1 NAD(P)-binding domain-containing protein [Natronoglycomyces albus]